MISSMGTIESNYLVDEDSEVTVLKEECTPATKGSNFQSKVVFTRKDDKRIEFLPTLDTVLEYWKKLLY